MYFLYFNTIYNYYPECYIIACDGIFYIYNDLKKLVKKNYG